MLFYNTFMDSHQFLECICLAIRLILGHTALSVSHQSYGEDANQEISDDSGPVT